jgi:8-oxo-dGTP pyrophosphatase MutT (NUDIX family)
MAAGGAGQGTWRVRRRQRLIDSPWLRVDREDVVPPHGPPIDDYYLVHEPDFAMVFAVTTDGQVVLVRQYKHGIGRVMLELPAGYLDAADGAPEAAARRELREETGYEAGAVRRLASLVSSPTRSPNRGHIFLATGSRLAGAQALDPNEWIEVLCVAPADLRGLVRAGAIEAQSSIAAIFLGLDALGL